MREAERPDKPVEEEDISGDKGVTDPTPDPVRAKAVDAKYHDNAPESGKVFDGPEGSMVCSATVVRDPAHPGKSNMVWTAGHCVHKGKKGGWYRNIAFVPSYNDAALATSDLEKATREQIAPYGVWWAEWVKTSDQWIAEGASTGGAGAPYDFAVIKVTPEKGSPAKSLEETVGSALPVEFNAPAVPKVASLAATGYPAAAPFDGQKMFQCRDKPGRLSLKADQPTMYRIGCTMTGGSSGGGWWPRAATASRRWCRTPRSARRRRAGSRARASARRPRASSTRSARSTPAGRPGTEAGPRGPASTHVAPVPRAAPDRGRPRHGTRPGGTHLRGTHLMRSVRLVPATLGLVTALALAATACGPTETPAADKPAAGASGSAPAPDGGDGGSGLTGDLADKLRKHGVDPDEWKDGEWRNWDRKTWLREAEDFVNPVIEGLWDPARMRSAKSPDRTIAAQAGAGGTDPTPRPVRAQREKTPYHHNAAPVGKIFFDAPQGHMVCSGTIVKDPRRPGKSNLVWTAGHCVHAGGKGGWYRNITFVPAFNDLGKSPAALNGAQPHEVYPYGQYWADWAVTSGEWIRSGGTDRAWPYDYAVLHVKPQWGAKSLEETVGAALPVDSPPRRPRGPGRSAPGVPAGRPVRRRDHAQVPGPGDAAHHGARDPGDVPDRLHDDRGFVRRRLVPGAAGREDGARVEHLDRPGRRQRLARGTATGQRRQGGPRDGQQEVRPLTRTVRRTAEGAGLLPEGRDRRLRLADGAVSARRARTAPGAPPVPRAPWP